MRRDAPAQAQLYAVAVSLRLGVLDRVSDDFGQICARLSNLEAAGMYLGVEQEIVDEPFEANRTAPHRREEASLLLGERVAAGVEQQLRVAVQRRQRSTELVRDRADQFVLCCVGRLERDVLLVESSHEPHGEGREQGDGRETEEPSPTSMLLSALDLRMRRRLGPQILLMVRRRSARRSARARTAPRYADGPLPGGPSRGPNLATDC